MTATLSPLTRREVTFYFLFASLLLLAVALVGIVFWAVTPPRNERPVGTLADFPPSDQPYYVGVGITGVWLVNVNGELLALNPQLGTFGGRMRCNVHWILTNNRFEDPCSGAKLRLDGIWLEPSTSFQPTHDPKGLERYKVEVRNGEVWIDLAVVTPGPAITGAPTP
jgi:hypothetical protein